MKRVTGIGGIFFKASDPGSLASWYGKHLGLAIDESFGGCNFEWRDADDPTETGYTVWSPFQEETDYFHPSDKPFMINFRVADLDALLLQLKEEGIDRVGEIESYDYGRFAWIMDPEGNKIELWEPPAG